MIQPMFGQMTSAHEYHLKSTYMCTLWCTLDIIIIITRLYAKIAVLTGGSLEWLFSSNTSLMSAIFSTSVCTRSVAVRWRRSPTSWIAKNCCVLSCNSYCGMENENVEWRMKIWNGEWKCKTENENYGKENWNVEEWCPVWKCSMRVTCTVSPPVISLSHTEELLFPHYWLPSHHLVSHKIPPVPQEPP